MIFKTEIKNATLMLALGTGLLYLHGSAFHSGYLRGFGIQNKLFPLDLQETLIYGCRAYSTLGLKAFNPIMIVLLGIFLFSLAAKYLSRFVWMKNLKGFFLEEEDDNRKKTFSIVNYLLNSLMIFFGIALPVIGIGVIYVLADAVGYEKGKVDKGTMENLVSEPRNWDSDFPKVEIQYVELKSNEVELKIGIIIESSKDYLAILTNTSTVLVPKENVKRIQIEKDKI